MNFQKFADMTARAVSHPLSFSINLILIVIWAALGPVFAFSDSWQLVVNTATTVITYLMVFLIQNTQNRDAKAIQAKLDELIRTSQASNVLIGLEELSQKEVEDTRAAIAQKAREEH